MDEFYNKQLNLIHYIQGKESTSEQVLRIEETSKSPFVFMDPKTGLIVIKGRGQMDNPVEFFRPVIEFLDSDFAGLTSIEGHFMLIWMTSSFGKPLTDFFIKIGKLYREKVNVTCYWYYEEDDYDILEKGEDFESFIKVPFIMIEMPG